MFSVFTWALFYFLWQLSADAQAALFWCRALVIGAFFAPVTHMHHVSTLVDVADFPLTRRLLRFGYASALGLCIANTTPLVVREVAPRLFFPYWPLPGPLWHFYTLCYFGYWAYSVRLICYGLSHSSAAARYQFQYLLIGTLIAFAGASTNFLLWYNIPIPPVGSLGVPFYVVLVALATIRYQFMDIQVVIRKSLVYSMLVAVITAVYFSVVFIAEKALQGVMGYRSLIGSVGAGFVITLGLTSLKEFVQRFVDRALFKATPAELVAQREQLLVEVRKSDQRKAVATLAAGMAHEIKNPLTSIKTFAAYLPEKAHDPSFQQKFQRIVTQEVDKIDQLVRQLLDFAKPTPPQLQPTHVSQLLDETLEFLSSECLKKRIQIERSYASDGAIQADPQQLRQVFLNLLLNSLEAMDGGGGKLSVTTAAGHGQLTVAIQDTGPGIPNEHLTRVFDPFFTTKPHGTGLGLSIVHSIITEHHGTIAFDSQPNHGTRCTLAFPLDGATG